MYELIDADTFPRVWEKAMSAVWNHGYEVRTDYDKPNDPPSKDLTAMLVVHSPEKEPKFHRCLPMGLNDLFDYVDEVTRGTRDHLADKLGYTYHQRLTDYDGINQLNYVTEDLKRSLHSRRAQAILWNPTKDPGAKHPPCLQRMWFRVVRDKLYMNIHMRSNDLYKATFSNMIAFYEIQKMIANKLDIRVGKYCHISDSLHIYGSYFSEIRTFFKSLEDRSWEERIWTTEEVAKLGFI